MSTSLYTVTVTDLGTYQVTVAADTVSEAQRIAKSVLHEEATQTVAGMVILNRETDAVAEVATEQPLHRYEVEGCFRLKFSLIVPAASASEAEQHARRIYDDNCGPFEFDHDGGALTQLIAREVVS